MTGSLPDWGTTGVSPVAGMGVTIDNWSERRPATVVEVKCFKSGARKGEPSEVVIQCDTWETVPGGTEVREYKCDPNGITFTYVRNVNDHWVRKGPGGRGSRLIVGRRELSLQPGHLAAPPAP